MAPLPRPRRQTGRRRIRRTGRRKRSVAVVPGCGERRQKRRSPPPIPAHSLPRPRWRGAPGLDAMPFPICYERAMAPPRTGNPALVARIEPIIAGPTWQSTYRILFLVGMRLTKRNDAEGREGGRQRLQRSQDRQGSALEPQHAPGLQGRLRSQRPRRDAARRRAAARTKAVVDADPDADDEPVSSGPAPVPAKPAPRHDFDEQDE